MTESETEDTTESKDSNDLPTQNGKRSRIERFSFWLKGFGNKKPAYVITRHGIEKRFFNFADTETLPFDTDTYKDTQIFIGSYANPWYFDIDAIENEYPDFTKEDITRVEDVFAKRHVYPSQKYKLLANQNALRDMFVGGAFDEQKIMRLLYAAIAGIGFIAIILVFGGA